MRVFIILFCQTSLHATFVASVVYPWVEGDLVGGKSTSVSFVDDGSLPLLVDLLFFEVVIFTGGNESPVTLYTSQRYNFLDESEVAQIDDPAHSRLGQKGHYYFYLSVPWAIGPNIARGYFLGIRSHFEQNENIEVITYTDRISMINNGTLPSEVEEAADAQGKLSGAGPLISFACEGQPCSEEAALSNISLTQPRIKKVKEPLTESQKFTIAFSATMGGIFLILLVGVIWRCRQRRSERKGSKRRWWNKIPPPEAGASELQGHVGPYTTAELVGDGQRGSVFELEAGSIRRQDSEGGGDGKGISSMEMSRLEETQRLQPSGDNINHDAKAEEVKTLRVEMHGSEARDVDEILPVDPQPSTFSSRYTKKRDRKHNSAPTPESMTRPPRDTSPHESTAMLGSSSLESSSALAPEVVVTRPASFPMLQRHSEYESVPRQSMRMADADLEALAGAFAPPAARPKPPPRTGGWVYR
ncbi:hypothetical protein DL98DRAFT_587178 [Cadophora sp. DSE1049]|nr:hypothetical protein DL98DRAFT_587178 [Cadophora sp. DSE1049]